MANSKIFRKTQERSAGLSNKPDDGYFGFEALVLALKKSQIKNCEPFGFLDEVTKKIRVRRNEIYGKLTFSNVHGSIKLMLAVGKNKDQAANEGKKFLVVGNVLSNEIDSLIPLPTNNAKDSIKIKNKKNKDTVKKSKTPSRSQNTKSLRFRRKRRTPNRRAKLRLVTKPSVDKFVIKDFAEKGIGAPVAFNTVDKTVTPRDFASIFEDSNNRLYNDSENPDVVLENPPAVSKYIGLGIDIDRPSIIMSTDLSPIIYDLDLDVYDQSILDRRFKIETVYRNLEKVEDEDITSLVETFEEMAALTEDATRSVLAISTIDDSLVKNISTDMLDLAATLGLNSSLTVSQIYAQVLHDIGAYSIFGTYKTEAGVRITSIKNTDINIDENYSRHRFSGRSIYNGILSNGTNLDATNPDSFAFGDIGTYLGYLQETDPLSLREASGTSANIGRSGLTLTLSDSDIPHIMQSIYYELLMSRLLMANDSNIASLKSDNYTNVVRAFLGDFADPKKSLKDVQVPTQLAAIIKYREAGENFYPLEQFLDTKTAINGRTFLDAVVQPAVGSIIEDSEPNFGLLDTWVENARGSLDNFFKYVDATSIDGGAPIVFNEIILGCLGCIADDNLFIGQKHPKRREMIGALRNNLLSSRQIAEIIFHGAKSFSASNQGSVGLANIYNTFGYGFFEGQSGLAITLGAKSTTGLSGPTNMSNATTAYGIGKTKGWKPTETRSINDGDDISEILNNAYQEFSRLFNIIENNIMVSIELLLSDLGLISISATPEYNTDRSAHFFDNVATSVKVPDRIQNNERVGNHQSSKFSGLPRFYVRALLAECLYVVLKTNFVRTDENLVKSAKVAVDNLDQSAGPVRFKVTHGTWPPEGADSTGLSAAEYANFVPSEIRTAREGEVDVEIEFDAEGSPESVNVSDPAAGWEFIDATEGFCPLTLFLDGEDNSTDGLSFVRANRALFDNLYDAIVVDRTRLHKMKHLVNLPVAAYQNFPTDLDEAVGSVSLDSLKSIAAIPGIDGQTIVKFTSQNQIYNMKVSNNLESPSVNLRYLPNKHVISDNEFDVARRFIANYTEKKYTDITKAAIHTVGIPNGLLSALKLSKSKFSLTREAEYMFYSNKAWSAKQNIYHPNIYLIPGSFSSSSPDESFDEIVLSAKYFISDDSTNSLMDYSSVVDYLGLTQNEAKTILQNHCLNYALQLAMKVTMGLSPSEDTFRISNEVNNLFVSSDGQKNIETLLSTVPSKFDTIFTETGIENSLEIAKKLDDQTVGEINTYIGSLESRLISPEDYVKKVFGTRLFDRVFILLTHPDEHYTTSSDVGLRRTTKEIDGVVQTMFQIDLKDDAVNTLRNNHFASYYFKVEKQ